MRSICVCLFFLGLSLAACNKDEPDSIPVQINSFPLAIGNEWRYHTDVELEDDSGNVFYTGEYDNLWRVISDTVINGDTAYKILQIDSNYTGSVHIGYKYYVNKPDGFYGVGSLNMGSMFELKSMNPFYNGIFERLQSPDTIFIPQTPIQFLKFPSNLNDTWDGIIHLGNDTAYNHRTYISYQTVSTNGLDYDCIRLQANMILNDVLEPEPTTYQDFGQKGLIAETMLADSLFMSGGYVKLRRATKLVFVNF